MRDDLALLTITDGRPCVFDTLARLASLVDVARFERLVIVTDDPDRQVPPWPEAGLTLMGRPMEVVRACPFGGPKAGFAGAVQAGWRALEDFDGHVFHLEDDFLLEPGLDLEAMLRILDTDRTLAQVVLQRNPVARAEHNAGGLLRAMRARGQHLSPAWIAGHEVTIHRSFFTTNPSVYPPEVRAVGWPDAPDSERKFGDELLRQDWRFAFLGSVSDPPRAIHVGRRGPAWAE